MASRGWENFTEADAERLNRSRTGRQNAQHAAAEPIRGGSRPIKSSGKGKAAGLPSSDVKTASPSKYRNVSTEVDGIRFDSKKEAQRYLYLKALQESGDIADLKRQTKWEIWVNDIYGGKVHCAWWLADFDYWTVTLGAPAEHRIEDVKSAGTRTAVYKLKKKLVEAIWNIEIREV